MKKILFSSTAALMLLLVVAGAAFAATGVTDPAVLQELAKVRQATAKYQDVNAALADGFISTVECTAEEGLGGMGIHFLNIDRIMDPAVNFLEPEILLYVETEGRMKLIGVEYFVALGPPGAPVPDPAPPAPVLFGVPFDGPMPGHDADMPPHYDLHVWVWQANPAGTFAMFNPNISCP